MIKRSIQLLLALLVIAPCLFADIITLVDKRVLHVKVLEPRNDGVLVERLDNGGRIFIKWSLIGEADRKRLRLEAGLEEDDSDADLYMDAHRIVLRSGDYHDGLVEAQSQNDVTFRTNRGIVVYPNSAIKDIQERLVNVFEIFKPEELYERKLQEKDPTDTDIEAQFEMARYASRVTIYDKAIEHYDKVKQIDPTYKAEYIANQLQLLEVLDKQKEIREAIKKAASAGYSNEYETCFAILDEVLGAPNVTKEVRKEVEEQKKKFAKRRVDYFSRIVVSTYYREVTKRIAALARDKRIQAEDEKDRLTIDGATTELRSMLHKKIVEDLAAKLKLDPKNEVEKWWKERKPRNPLQSSYGTGTFIVSGDKDAGGGGDSGADQVARQFERLARALNRGNQQQQQQPQARAQLDNKDQWWRKVSSTQREYFLRSWFAENGGQFEVVRTYDRPCEQCGATGSTKETGGQGAIIRVTCTRCHGNKGDRVVLYR